MSGLVDDVELTARARMAAIESARLGEFEAGWASGRDERVGNLDEDLAEDTLLGAIGRWTSGRIEVEHKSLDRPEDVALWEFNKGAPRIYEGACGLVLHDIDLAEESDASFLRFGHFGESSVELELEVREQPKSLLWSLELCHLASSRPYYPDQGVVTLEVSLDGRVLQGAYLVTDETYHIPTLEIPTLLLEPGRHVLLIRTSIGTNTTYRLRWVLLQQT
jgi:hypothetical protein